MKVFKFRCNKCKETTQSIKGRITFNEGCPLCPSKSITVMGYVDEVLQ